MKMTVKTLERRLQAQEQAQLIVSVALFEALLALAPKAAQIALARVTACAADPGREDEDEEAVAVAALLASHVAVFEKVLAHRSAAVSAREVLKRAKAGQAGPSPA